MSNKTNDKRKAEEEPELDDEQASEEEEDEDADEEGAEGESEDGDDGEDSDDSDDEEEDDEEEEDEEDDEEEEDEKHGGHQEAAAKGDDEDPYWWTPHVVLAVLVLIGLLGFFGLFNKTLGFLAAKPAAPVETPAAAAPAPQPMPAPKPLQPQQVQQPQAPREMFGAKHFLVMYKGGQRAPASITRTKEEAKVRAEEGLKKIKAGKKFEEVVGEYSDEPNAAQRGGDLGTFPKGAMIGPFQDAVEKLKVGEISGLVETAFGYHVILRTK